MVRKLCLGDYPHLCWPPPQLQTNDAAAAAGAAAADFGSLNRTEEEESTTNTTRTRGVTAAPPIKLRTSEQKEESGVKCSNNCGLNYNFRV